MLSSDMNIKRTPIIALAFLLGLSFLNNKIPLIKGIKNEMKKVKNIMIVMRESIPELPAAIDIFTATHHFRRQVFKYC
jgi:hypothetical protein